MGSVESKQPLASDLMTIQIEEYESKTTPNLIYKALKLYLQEKISPSARLLKLEQTLAETKFSIQFSDNQMFEDVYEEIRLSWKFNSVSGKSNKVPFFELQFDAKHQKKVIDGYLPYVVETSNAMEAAAEKPTVTLMGRNKLQWSLPIHLKHPATLKNLAIDPEQKRSILEDLDRFVKEKEFSQRVGRIWRRVYLIYGPPGTGKSSLVAAIANHLNFHIYVLQLTQLESIVELRTMLLSLEGKSIILVENIDFSLLKLQGRRSSTKPMPSDLLKYTEGLWSSSGEERIIIFTTNHEKSLDPALLLSGRLDMHIHMSYCSFEGFKTLASTYLGINEHQPLFDEIETLLQDTKVRPAQVAKELMKSNDADVALPTLITMLKKTRNKGKDEYQNEDEEKVLNYYM